jgi:hypothetical protein
MSDAWHTTWQAPLAPPTHLLPPLPFAPMKVTRPPRNQQPVRAFGGKPKKKIRFVTHAAPPFTPPSYAKQPRRLWGIAATSSSGEKDLIGSLSEPTTIESDSVTPGIFQEDADLVPAIEVDTSAPSAAPTPMAPLLVRPRPPWPVTTPLRLDRWRFHLGRFDLIDEYANVLHGIEFGFSYRSSLSISETRIYPNMRSASEFPEVIDKKIEKELAAGRYKGPFSKSELETLIGPFIAHPLGVVQKDESSKPRLVEDLSFPHNGDSINSLTDVSDMTLDWGGLAETIAIMVSAPDGTQAASLDIEHAYRTIGITPSEFWLGVIQDNYEKFLVDLAAKFGGKSCGFNFEGPAKGFCALCVLIFLYLSLVRWVDDVMPIRFPTNTSPPYTYAVTLEDICELGRDLGFSFAKEKLVDFGPMSKYLGFVWCWDSKEVLIPDDKRTKYLDAVMLSQSKDSISLESLRSLCGKLSHIAMIVLEGRVNLRNLWRMLANMEKKGIHEKVSWKLEESHLKDLRWWELKLGEPRIGIELCTMAAPDDSFGLFCDASTSFGIGVVIEGKAEAFKFKPGWQSAGGVSRDIGYAEFAALHFLLFFFFSSRRIRNHHIKVHSDNAGVVGAWKKRSSKNPQQNEILGQILRILISRQCFMTLEYVRSEDNPADGPSRGIFTEAAKKTSFRGFPAGYSDIISRIK